MGISKLSKTSAHALLGTCEIVYIEECALKNILELGKPNVYATQISPEEMSFHYWQINK